MTLPDPIALIAGTSGQLGRALLAELAGRGARVHPSPWEPQALTEGTLEALAELAPTHVFFVEGPNAQRVRTLVEACAALERAPRFVLVSSRGGAQAEQVLRASGLPFTIARPGLVRGAERGGGAFLAQLLQGWSWLAARLGAHQHARRHRPTDAAELAFGLAHAAFNYTTINRVLQAEELRYDQANHDQHHVPATRRDHRH